MSKQVEAKNHLPDNFYRQPDWASCTMTRQELRETIEYVTTGSKGRDGILACGRIHPLQHEKIGPNLYKVTLDYQG